METVEEMARISYFVSSIKESSGSAFDAEVESAEMKRTTGQLKE